MKKLLAILMVLIMILGCLSLASCGEAAESEATKGDGATQSEKPVDTTKATEATKGTGAISDPDGEDGGEKEEAPLSELEAALALLDSIKDVVEVSETNYVELKLSYESAKAGYDELSADDKNAYGDANKQILDNVADIIKSFETLVKNDPLKYYQLQRALLPTIQTYKGTVTVDGKIEKEIIDNCTPMMLTKEKCYEWNSQGRNDGAGIVGDTSLAADAKTEVEFFIVYDEDNLYVIERRCDLTWNFTATTYSQSYTGDGSIIWFVNVADAEDWISGGSVENGDQPACGLMWSAGVYGEQPGSNNPQIAYFPEDDQGDMTKKNPIDGWQRALAWDEDEHYYVLELAIPWSELPFSAEDIEAGNIAATFCSVDIVNSAFDGDKTKLWSGMGYQMQYPGVNNWCWSQSLAVKE